MKYLKRAALALAVIPLLALAEAPFIEYVNEGIGRWQCVEVVDGADVVISSHAQEEKALQCATDKKTANPDGEYRAVSTQRIRVIFSEAFAQLLAGIDPFPEDPPNFAPTWTCVPSGLNFTEGVGGTGNLGDCTNDAEGDPLTYAEAGGPWGANLSLASNGTLTVTGSLAAGTYSSLSATVSDGINSPVTSSFFTVTVIQSSSQGKKWHPGNYYKVQGQAAQADQTAWLNKVVNAIGGKASELDGTNAEMNGILAPIAWGVGNPTGGTWDDAQIDAILAEAEVQDKYVILMLSYKSFLGQGVSFGHEAPADLSGQIYTTNTGVIAAIWETSVMNRFIDWLDHIAAKYDSHPRLEVIMTTEPVPSLSQVSLPPGYTTEKLRDSLIRMTEEACPNYVKTIFAPGTNHLGGSGVNDYTDELLDAAKNNCGASSNPDMREVDAMLWYEGTKYDFIDKRGTMARITTVSESSWRKTSRTTPQIIDYSEDQAVTHPAWVSQDVYQQATDNTYSWDNANPTLGTKEALKNDWTGYHATCPTEFANGCE